MVTLDKFKEISFDKKCEIVTLHSNYIAMRAAGNCKIYLYHTGSYFVEVFYSTSMKKVVSINAFNEVSGLELYADAISLTDLAV